MICTNRLMNYTERITNRVTEIFSGLPTYDLWSLGCILYHLLFGSPLCNVDSQQINSLRSIFIYHCSLMNYTERITNRAITIFSGPPTYDCQSLECILYHLLFGSPLCNVDSQQINSLLSFYIYHCFHFFAMFMPLLQSFLGIFKNMRILENKDWNN